jgi:hypothetical protein
MKVRSADAGVTQATTTVPAGEDTTQRTRAVGGRAPVDRANLSRMGVLLNRLQDLATQDPARYDRAVASFSSRLDEVAAGQPGAGGEMMEALSRKVRLNGPAAHVAANGRAAVGNSRATPADSSALEDLLEASLKETATHSGGAT